MYIFPKSNVAYIHIPKCGGTSLKKLLMNAEFYDHNNRILNSREEMKDGKIVDLSHLTLAQISYYFPDLFEKLLSMSVFTVIRNPNERIFSSIFQSIRMYGNANAMDAEDRPELLRQVDDLIDHVKKYFDENKQLPYELVHFNRQIDYISFREVQVVKNIFRLDDEGEILRWINMKMNTCHTVLPKENFAHKRSGVLFKGMQEVAKITPKPVKTFLKTKMNVSLNNLEHRMARPLNIGGLLNDHKKLLDFVDDYYQSDLKIYSESVK